jgi:DNA-binding MarR family transcriptional regulator
MVTDSLVARAIVLAQAIGKGMHQRGDDAWLRSELTLAQIRCLFVVVVHGPISIGGIGERLRVGLPSASTLADRLVEQGLVDRREDPTDRRRTLASATPAGADLAERLRQGSMDTLRAWLGALRREDLAALVQGMEAIAEVAELTACTPRPAEGAQP